MSSFVQGGRPSQIGSVQKPLFLDTSLPFSFPFSCLSLFFFLFHFMSVSILLSACAGGEGRGGSDFIQKQKWKRCTGRRWVLSWSGERTHPAAGSQPAKADRSHRLLSRKPPHLPPVTFLLSTNGIRCYFVISQDFPLPCKVG